MSLTTSSSAQRHIQVFLRVRPLNRAEQSERHGAKRLQVVDESDVTVVLPNSSRPTLFRFDGVFDPLATQREVYNKVAARAVDAALQGEHGVVFAYGQTGSGKTFTVANTEQGPRVTSNGSGDEWIGLVPRAFRDVWHKADASPYSFEMALSVVQLYQEKLYNLLGDEKQELKYRHLQDSFVSVGSYETALELFLEGFAKRETASTGMNAQSSRSHVIVTLNVTRCSNSELLDGSPRTRNEAALPTLAGKLIICDLAGSERLSKTNASGVQQEEGIAINLSLLSLGNAVSAIAENSRLGREGTFVQFRDSLLTRVLQDALMGKGDTSIVVTVSPSDDNIVETWHAIEFGQRARSIKQDTQRHEMLNYRSMYAAAFAEVAALKEQLRERDEVIHQLRQLQSCKEGGVSLKHSTAPTASTTDIDLDVSESGSATPVAQVPSTSRYSKVVDDLQQEIDERDDVITELENEQEYLLTILQREMDSRTSLVRDFAATQEEVKVLQATLKGLQERAMAIEPLSPRGHASPYRGGHASPRGQRNGVAASLQRMDENVARRKEEGKCCCTMM